ncbi:MAG: GTP cyclohydrolase II, partial [Candidatus Theseobacter exili]|nr:GTP cyclohydrolase II [Candidatus Theseobacter exili]
FISIQDVFEASVRKKQFVKKTSEAFLPTEFGDFRIIGFENSLDQGEHFAVVKGDISAGEVHVRIHSECVTGDVFHSLKCDCRDQLVQSLRQIESIKKGIVIYLRQEGRGIGITNKIKTYCLQEKGLDTYDANIAIGRKADERDYAVAAQILNALNVKDIVLLTNNPQKIEGLKQYGVHVKKRVEISGQITSTNEHYILSKIKRFHHDITVPTSKK